MCVCEGVGGCLSWIDQQLLGCFLFDAWIVNELQMMMWPQVITAWSDRCPARAATLTFHLLKTTEIQKQQQKKNLQNFAYQGNLFIVE